MMTAAKLRECCDSCRTRVDSLVAAGVPAHLVVYCADPLMSVDLRDRRWPERFAAEHPNRPQVSR